MHNVRPHPQSIRGERMLRRGQQAHRNQGAFFYGDLWAFWAQGLPPGTITFNTTVTDLGPDPFSPRVGGETFDLAIIADGGWSSLRTRYFGPEAPEYAGWQVGLILCIPHHCDEESAPACMRSPRRPRRHIDLTVCSPIPRRGASACPGRPFRVSRPLENSPQGTLRR